MSIAFIFFGVMKTINTGNMQNYMEGFGVPGKLIWLAIIVQIGCGTLIVVGYQTRLAALALAGFCVIATSIFHTRFFNDGSADLGQVSDFTKDLAATGGFLFLFVIGPGKLSLDYLVANKSR